MISSSWGPLTLTRNPTKFGGHWYCGCGNTDFFRKLRDFKIDESHDSMNEIPFP